MKTLVLYDSAYGNTEQIARAIGSAIACDVDVLRIGEVNPSGLEPVDFLFIGSPTQSGKPTQAMTDFLDGIPEAVLKRINLVAFDTRLQSSLAGLFGYAAGKIANNLRSKGASLVSSPEGFFVKGKEGPLKEGEPERAALWAENISASFYKQPCNHAKGNI
jgi:flavodoxin I